MSSPLYSVTIKGHRYAVEHDPMLWCDSHWTAAGVILLAICVRMCTSKGSFTSDLLSTEIIDYTQRETEAYDPFDDLPDRLFMINYVNSNRSALLAELCEKKLVVII